MKMENNDDQAFEPFPLPRRSSSEPQEFFEFLHAGGEKHAVSSAEDIIFRGRLVPFRELPPPPGNSFPSLRRRSESLSAIQSGSAYSAAEAVVMRASRSLDYQRLRRCDGASAADKASPSPKKPPARLRWPAMLMFGAVKVPAEMELGDIKSRQARRRNSSAAVASGGASWRLLKALSCKDHASVAVTASKSLRI